MLRKVLLVFKTPLLKCPRARRLHLILSQKHQCQYLCAPELNELKNKDRYGIITKKIQSPFLRWLQIKALKLKFLRIAEIIESNKFVVPDVQDGEFDYIFVHDLYLFPHFSHYKKTKVIFDAREYYPLEMAENPEWLSTKGKLAQYTCETYFPRAHQVVTVSPSLVTRYEQLINRHIDYFPSYPREALITRQLDTNALRYPIRFIHHGGVIRNRGLHLMVELLKILGADYQLDMMLVAAHGNKYYDELVRSVEGLSNVRILKPVHPDKIIEKCASYDCGLYIMEVNDSQNRYCLPNKFFEFIAAGLPVITSFSEDMKSIVDEHNIGVAFGDESLAEIAEKIKAISVIDIELFAANAKIASRTFTLEKNIKRVFPELA